MDWQGDGRFDLQFGESAEVGLQIHFGNPKLETKRLTRHK
jgi:hypothetical protein